jgi:hydroxymethylbilane synthase
LFLKLGVRGDKLSLARADLIVRMIGHVHPDAQVERKILEPSDDNVKPSITKSRGRKRTFDTELSDAILEGKIDFAIFNMKDLPFLKSESVLVIAATPERSSPYEALVSGHGQDLKSLKPGSLVGASTLLRIAQLRRSRPDLRSQAIGGRIEDRISMLDRGELDALIIAESGLARLGMSGRITQRLPIDDFMPMPCQGITALVTRVNNPRALQALKPIDNQTTHIEAEAEREVETLMSSDSNVPLGAYATAKGDKLRLTACVLSPDGKEILRASAIGPTNDPTPLAKTVVSSLVSQGVRVLEESWRKMYPLVDD